MHWQLNRIQYPVYNLGPGKRIVVWTQGCGLACPGCVNPSLWKTDGGKSVPVEWLLQKIINLAQDYDGITISGGEPFNQYEPMIAFCSFVKLKTKLNIFVYSGYSLEEIKRDHADRLFINCIDYLLDGRYIHEMNQNECMRGSANQRLYKIDNGVITETDIPPEKMPWSVHVGDDKEIFLTGIPGKNDPQSILDELFKTGIKTEFV